MSEKKAASAPIYEDTLTTSDVAEYCGVSVVHVTRWLKRGKLKCFRYPGGRYKITEKNFREFLQENNIPIVESFFEARLKKKILIGEDEAEFAKHLQGVLKANYPNFEIEAVNDGYEVLLKMGAFQPDLLILDIRMPKIDGLEVCRRVRDDESDFSDVKIMAMTGHSDKYTEEQALENGANVFLVKPFKLDIFLQHVSDLIGVSSKTHSA